MKKFKRVYIEISNICNLQCSFCPEVIREKKIMSLDLFSNTIKEVAPLTEQVCLHLMGEPLAHPQFPEILKICEQAKVKIQLTTNGILINRYFDQLLNNKAIHQINFSIHSFKDNFKNKDIGPYLQTLLEFTKSAHLAHPDMYINFRLWNIIDPLSNLDSNLDIIETIADFYQIEINKKIDVQGIKSKRIWNKVYLHFDSKFDWPNLNMPRQSDQGFCHGLSSHFGILADGSVVPCCLDKEAIINLGNCQEKSLTEILQSDRAQKMVLGFQQKKLAEDLCQRCTYIKRF